MEIEERAQLLGKLEELHSQINVLTFQIAEELSAIQRVRELHKPVDNYCDECSMYLVEDKYSVYIGYPCDTIKALDGEQ